MVFKPCSNDTRRGNKNGSPARPHPYRFTGIPPKSVPEKWGGDPLPPQPLETKPGRSPIQTDPEVASNPLSPPHQQPCWVSLGRSVPGRTNGQTDRWTDAHPIQGPNPEPPSSGSRWLPLAIWKAGKAKGRGKKCRGAKSKSKPPLRPATPGWGGIPNPRDKPACPSCALPRLPQLQGWAWGRGGGSRGSPHLFTGLL